VERKSVSNLNKEGRRGASFSSEGHREVILEGRVVLGTSLYPKERGKRLHRRNQIQSSVSEKKK